MYCFNDPSILKIKAHFTKLYICSSMGKLWLMSNKCTGNKFIESHRRCSAHNSSTAHFCVQKIALQVFKHDWCTKQYRPTCPPEFSSRTTVMHLHYFMFSKNRNYFRKKIYVSYWAKREAGKAKWGLTVTHI